MSQIMPIPAGSVALGSFRYQITVNNGDDLDGTTLSLRYTWFERLSGWYLDIFDADGDTILGAQRIAPGAVLAFPSDIPPGRFAVFGSDDYLQTDLGTNLQLVYFTPTEVQAIDEDPNRMTLGP